AVALSSASAVGPARAAHEDPRGLPPDAPASSGVRNADPRPGVRPRHEPGSHAEAGRSRVTVAARARPGSPVGACAPPTEDNRTLVMQKSLARHLPGYIENLRIAANRRPSRDSEPQVTNRRRQLTHLRRQAEGVMRAIQQGRLEGRALQEALGTYQSVWTQGEAVGQEHRSPGGESSPIEIRYDRAVVEDFVTRLPEALRADVRLGREFL